jgi:hypothetical protein
VEKRAPETAQEISPFEALMGEPVTTAAATPHAAEPGWGDLADILSTELVTPSPQEAVPIDTLQAGTPQGPPLHESDIVELVELQPETAPPLPATPKAARTTPPAQPADEMPSPPSLDAALALLAEARDRDAIAETLVAYVGQNFARVALFMVKGKIAAGWKARVRKEPVPGFESFQLPLDEPSALKIVADTKNFYLGPILDAMGNTKTMAALGGGAPSSALLIPLLMMGRVVTIFYVDGGEDLGRNLFELQKLVGKASLAFEILILKSKILLG